MWLLVGLGNPGKTYEKNRHNVGFMALDEFAARGGFPAFSTKFSGVWSRQTHKSAECTLLKPQTFMNLSGDSVQPAAVFLKVPPAKIVVLHDELEIPFGEVRVKIGGGHSGHNGLRSMIERLGSPEFARVRLGIGRPPEGFRGTVADFVLANFGADEQAAVSSMIDRTVETLNNILEHGAKPTPPNTGKSRPRG